MQSRMRLQRLLAHRTAQYHGLQTATVDDGGDDHGKIRATRPLNTPETKVRCVPASNPTAITHASER